MARCKHPRFKPSVRMERMDVTAGSDIRQWEFILVVRAKCAACGSFYVFKGQEGLSTSGPTVSTDHRELRAPIVMLEEPGEKDEDKGPN